MEKNKCEFCGSVNALLLDCESCFVGNVWCCAECYNRISKRGDDLLCSECRRSEPSSSQQKEDKFLSANIMSYSKNFRDMTLRDYFAAKVMQGLISEGGEYTDPGIGAEIAYRHADAMLKEREK